MSKDKAPAPRRGIPLDKSQILDLIPKLRGNISAIADHLGCSRKAVHKNCQDDPELAEALAQARERRVDKLEETVWDRAINGVDTGLQIFLLKTQAKSRGYAQESNADLAKDIAQEAFKFIIDRSKNPVDNK